ncbi:MAG: hypothetical protein IPK67_19195 [Planctomycetes bacterium]|nr:hypothetical protein [Planctomycetota bacterium]
MSKSALHKPAGAKSGAKRGRPKGGARESAAHPAGYVNTGFASQARPQEFLDQRQTLRTSERCWFALQIGELLEGIAAGQPVNIPAGLLPARAQLEVALFSFPNEIELGHGSVRGALELGSDGVGTVLRQPVEGLRGKEERDLKALLGKQEIWKQRLFFPVQMGPQPGPQRLRCSLYYKQTLVHSRVVQVLTRKGAGSSLPGPVDGSISFKTDYLLTRKLNADALTGFKENDLSLMLNGTDGTHQLRIFGKHDVQEDVHFSSATLDTLVRELRAVLRAAAWGDIEEWSGKPGVHFRYGGTQTLDQLGADLVTMARAGRRCFDVLRRTANAKLAGQGQRLESLVSEPSYIQFASRTTSSELVPVAVLYDRPLDPNDPHLTLCSAFKESLADPALPDLEDSRCWKGQCPSRDKDTVVCPSGFWGFRHYLGLPLTIDGASGVGSTGAASDLGCTAEPRLTVAVSTDPQFSMREQHVAQIRQLFPGVGLADSREKTLAALTGSPGHVAYFYCHGDYVGLRKDIPALLVGPVTSARIDASLISQRVRWEGVRPLVFLNGCRTTALLPSQSFGMVSAFVQDANAAGVIGTEITIFEPLATRFGMEFLRGLLDEELEVGVAMRRARLKLLKEKNPLGLVYISFALSRLRLRTV